MAIPGLINAHTHAGMTMMRGCGTDLPLMEWLQTVIWPMEERLTGEDVYWGTRLGALEMIRSGVTCFQDMYWFGREAARAISEVGARAFIACALVDVRGDGDELLDYAKETIGDQNSSPDRLIEFLLGPHAIYTCPPNYMKKVVKAAEELDTRIHIHACETESEVAECVATNGLPPIALLDRLGVFEHPTSAAHCIYLEAAEVEILASRSVSAIHNPVSNMKLASGVMDLETLMGAGINIALGTDSAASNDNLSVLAEMRTAALLQKVWLKNVRAISADEALWMATRGGAVAVGAANRIGQLTAGFEADITVLRNDGVTSWPHSDPISSLCYSLSAQDVDTVLVAGKPVLRQGDFVDVDVAETLAKTAEIVARLK